MPFVQLSTGNTYYLEQGGGEPLVLLHANPGDSEDYAAVIPELSRSHRVLALDWPGYGRSDHLPQPGTATVTHLQQMLREFIAALSLPPALFIGNSVGGQVAARLAIDLPSLVRGLVLVAPGGFTPHNVFTRMFCRFQGSGLSLSPYRFARLYLKHRTSATEAMLQRAKTFQATPERIALNRALWRSFAQPESDLRAASANLRVPTLLLFGRDDPTIPASRDGQVAANSMPTARLSVLPCGHAPFAEIPDLFLEQVQAFLSELRYESMGAHE